jgi:uncharacterized cupin superfamily protein
MIVRRSAVPVETRSSPGWGSVDTARLGDAGGITQFGVSLQVLQPGAKSSIRHWHHHVDEYLFVVSGEVTVTEDDGAHVLQPGDSACWPAGVRNGHTVSNRSASPCSYLIVGTRGLDESGEYVDDPDAPRA